VQHELDLQIALGRALMAARGYSAPVVADTLVRARALAERFDRPDRLVPLLYSQWGFHMVRAEHELAVSLAEQMEKLGETKNDQTSLLLGHYIHGASCYGGANRASGRISQAITQLEKAGWSLLDLNFIGLKARRLLQQMKDTNGAS